MGVTEFTDSPLQSSAGDTCLLLSAFAGCLEFYLPLSLWRRNWNPERKSYDSFCHTFCLPTFSLWSFLSSKASSALLYCGDNAMTQWLPGRACSILHLGLFWAWCCSQGSCLDKTSTLLGRWTWEEPQPKSHSCHGLRWGVVRSVQGWDCRAVEGEHCCAVWYHFVSTGTSRTSVVYRTSAFLFPLTSAVGW